MLNFIKKKIDEYKEEKRILKQIQEEEKQIEKEIDELTPETSFSPKEILTMLREKSEDDIEYESYLTEEEKAELLVKQKEEKRIIVIAATVIVTIIVATTIGVTVFYNANKSDLLKITQPLLSEYYKEKYNQSLKVKSIQELTTKGKNNEEIGTGIYLLTTKDNNHIMSVNNELIGDDISTQATKNELFEYLDNHLQDLNLITHSLDLSYQDYYLDYNRYLDYINTIPTEISTEELINSGKLTVTYKAIYQGFVNDERVLALIENFSDDSSFYFIKQELGGPTSLKIVRKDKVVTLDITAQIAKDENITYMELDREKNSITDVEIKRYTDTSTKGNGNYAIKNPLEITYDSYRSRDDDKEEYYLLRFDSSLVNENTIVELSTSKRDGYYNELEEEDYEEIILIPISSYTYLISQKEVFIGQKSQKNSILCNLGIC